jgi:hypothetical protein
VDRTPNKHLEILPIEGDAAEIEAHGIRIESLGDQMKAAARILDTIALGAECRGESLDKIKDSVGDASADLRTAGERYQPSGGHILRYGRRLDSVQRRLDTILPDLEELWDAYTREQSSYERDAQLPDPEPGESTADRTSAADVAAKRELWEDRAVDYEHAYDSWWTAYDDARKGVQQANDDGVEDSWLDNMLPAIEVLLVVLAVAGIVLAIAACIVGGPFILAAALVGLASLVLTVAKVSRGRGDALDVVVAAIGVFPFGKAFSLVSGLRSAASGARLATLGRGLVDMGGDIVGAGWRNGSRFRGVIDAGDTARVFHNAGEGALNRNGTRVLRDFFEGPGSRGPSMVERLLRGRDAAQAHHFIDAVGGLSTRARGNLAQFLGSTPHGSVVQAALAAGPTNAVVDVLDGIGKAAGGFAYEVKGWLS